jgi:hypothetical protein
MMVPYGMHAKLICNVFVSGNLVALSGPELYERF